jgi:hypothetical protein
MTIDLKNIVSHPIWVALEADLEAERDKRIRRLLSGNCSETEYHAVSGEIRGIELVLKTPYKRMITHE